MVNPGLGKQQMCVAYGLICTGNHVYPRVPLLLGKVPKFRGLLGRGRQANEVRTTHRKLHLRLDLNIHETPGWPKGSDPHGHGGIIVPNPVLRGGKGC